MTWRYSSAAHYVQSVYGDVAVLRIPGRPFVGTGIYHVDGVAVAAYVGIYTEVFAKSMAERYGSDVERVGEYFVALHPRDPEKRKILARAMMLCA